MLEEKMFNNLPQNEHLHSPLEENTLDYQSEIPSYSLQDSRPRYSFLHPPNKKILFIAASFIFTLFLIANSWNHETTLPMQNHKIFMIKENHLIEQRFPKILWIYTQNQRDAQYMQDDIYHNYFTNQANAANYVVREVNSLTAYDYLNQQAIKNITETMNKRRIDETVHSLLKLALLLENGGLLISSGTILLDNNFRWIQYMFDKYSNEQEKYNCMPQKSSLFISQHEGTYNAKILAAVPQNPFLRELLAFMSEVIMSEQLQKQNLMLQRYNISGLTWNPTLRVYSFRDSISDCINHLMKVHNKQNDICYADTQSAKVNLTLLIDSEKQPTRFFTDNKLDIINQLLLQKKITNRNEVQAIIGFNTNKINSILTELAIGKFTTTSIQNSLMYTVLQVPGNKEVFLEELPQRNIELCLIIMEALTKEQLIYTSTLFNHQTNRNWRLIMPAADIANAPKFNDYRITVMQSKSTKVHNIEKAATRHCSDQGYAVVLNFNQTFENRSAFHSIAKAAQPRQVVGVYIPLKSNTDTYYVRQNYTTFYRFTDGIVNPKLDMMKHIINHMRVFSVQTFRTIPQFALRDWNGKYLKDRLIFLMDFHDLIHRDINEPEQLYVIKKNANIWNIPTKISILEDVAALNIQNLEEVDQAQLKLTRARVSARNVKYFISDLHRYKVPMSKMVAINPGDDFVPVEQKTGPQIVPRIVHQVWLGGKIPPAKQYFIQKTRRIYSGYEIKVWKQDNITKELFPTTYDIIKTLIEFNKGSPYNKLATVTDIMRHEILYREGGLWKDAGMNMLRPIPDAFLKYKLILSTDRLYQYRYLQGMCFFGNIPKYQNMLRINNYRNLNRMRIHSSDPLGIAGPVDFRQLLIGQEEFDPEIILMPYQTFYPGQVGQHPEGDLCTTKQLKKNQNYEIVEGGWYLLPGCEQKYPYAFAIEHNNYGSSWVGAKQLAQLLKE